MWGRINLMLYVDMQQKSATEVHNVSLYRPCHTEYFHPLSKHCQLSASTSLAASLELFIICTIPTVYSSFYWLTSNTVFYHKQFLSDTTSLSPCFAFDCFLQNQQILLEYWLVILPIYIFLKNYSTAFNFLVWISENFTFFFPTQNPKLDRVSQQC